MCGTNAGEIGCEELALDSLTPVMIGSYRSSHLIAYELAFNGLSDSLILVMIGF